MIRSPCLQKNRFLNLNKISKQNLSASIDLQEVEKFSRIADEWWDKNGKFAPLHKLNPARAQYISNIISQQHGNVNSKISLLDIGCGGGILSESMAKIGIAVSGIDASEKNIKVASLHAAKSGLDINYICTSAEDLAREGKQFDVVLNMEVIEHVADVNSFMQACCKLLKPGGIMFVGTLNRTIQSYALAIIGAEYILRWLPRGTHDWKKFLRPSEVNMYLEENGLKIQDIAGISFNPLENKWHISQDTKVNYIISAIKL